MCGAYAWLTNAIAVDRLKRRLLLIGGMGGFLIVALAIPETYDAHLRPLRPRAREAFSPSLSLLGHLA
jgi:hypothetical protein